jgi:hypothetical protein
MIEPMSSSPTRRAVRRRPLLVALAGGAAAVTGIGIAARTGLGGSEPGSTAGELQLSGGGAMGVEALELPLQTGVLTRVGPARWQSPKLTTTTHSMVAFTWRRGDPEPHIDISSRINGVWQPWQRVPHAHDAPDPDSEEVGDTVGTDLAWTGPADGIRLRVSDSRPANFTLVLLHPTALPGDHQDDGTGKSSLAGRAAGRSQTADTAPGSVPRPRLHSRRDWGANEDLRDGSPVYIATIKQVHVHHTVNSNDYARDDVPALIRGMYAYHTQSLGWSDIGYNFLVDRFGRIWVGRAGGAARPVRGAHTLGFNATSTGVSVIGNFDVATPSAAVIAGIARVASWKLDMYSRDPQGRTTVTSEGSDKFPVNRRVTLPVIDGHRDTNDTACPGQHLYDALPAVRRRTRARMDRFHQPQAAITQPFTGSGSTIDGEVLTVQAGVWTPADTAPSYTWLRNGAAIDGATAASYRLVPDDVGSRVSVRVDIAPADGLSATQTITFPDLVKARPVLVVKAAGRRGRAVVRVKVTAAGLEGSVSGPVVIALAGRSRTLELVDGRARAVFRSLPPDTYEVQASYAGDETVASAAGADPVTVKPA